jgi:hypothetical protein
MVQNTDTAPIKKLGTSAAPRFRRQPVMEPHRISSSNAVTPPVFSYSRRRGSPLMLLQILVSIGFPRFLASPSFYHLPYLHFA